LPIAAGKRRGFDTRLVTYFDYAISGWRSWIVGHAAIFT
jgi:hypothetical protein